MARGYSDAKIYVGDLGNNASKSELEDAFSYYGRLRNVWVARNPPGFAFVEFDDTRDAEDAVRGLDGRTICGRRVRVELSSGRRRSGRGGNRNIRDERCYDCGERGHFARDCRKGGGGGGRTNRRRSPSRSRSRDRRSESRDRSRSASRNRSRTPERRREDRSPRED